MIVYPKTQNWDGKNIAKIKIPANPPEIGTKGVCSLFISLTTKPILFRYLISQGVMNHTMRKLSAAHKKGVIIIKYNQKMFIKMFLNHS